MSSVRQTEAVHTDAAVSANLGVLLRSDVLRAAFLGIRIWLWRRRLHAWHILRHVSNHTVGFLRVEKICADRLAAAFKLMALVHNWVEADAIVGIEGGRQFPAKEAVHHVFNLFFGHRRFLLFGEVFPVSVERVFDVHRSGPFISPSKQRHGRQDNICISFRQTAYAS